MPLSLSVSSTLYTASLFSLSFTLVHTQKHLHKRKSNCFNFHPCPLFFPSPALFLVEKIYMLFFPGSFMQTLSSSADPPPPLPPSHCTNTADRRWTRCHDTVACRPTNPSVRQPAGPKCVSLALECV